MSDQRGLNRDYAITSSSEGKKCQLIWIYLNDGDNDEGHFWQTFIWALIAWDIDFTQEKRQLGFPSDEEAIQNFIHDFLSQLDGGSLVLQFVHAELISNKNILDFFEKLSCVDPRYLSTVFIFGNSEETDKVPCFINGSIEHDLCLDEQEELKYYKKEVPTFRQEEFAVARSYTEGWKPAVLLVCSLLKEKGIFAFGNFDENILAWYESIVLSTYSEAEMQQFVELSLLENFSIDLVCHLKDWNQSSIDKVIRGNPALRLDPISGVYIWSNPTYQYMQNRQSSISASEKKNFYLRAGDWYLERGNKIEAINCYRKGQDHKKVFQAMKQWSFPNSRECAHCYVQAIEEMPETFIENNPIITPILGQMLSALYRYTDVVELMSEFTRKHDKGEETPARMKSVLGEAYILLANSAQRVHGEVDPVSCFKKASEYLPQGSSMLNMNFQFADVPAIMLLDKTERSMDSYLKYVQETEPYVVKACSGSWSGVTYLAQAELNYYRRKFKEAEPSAQKAIKEALERDQYDIVCSACFLLMRLNMAKGNYEKLIDTYELLNQYAAEVSFETFFTLPDIAESWLFLKLGKRHKVSEWLKNELEYERVAGPWMYGRDRVIRILYLLEGQQYRSVISRVDGDIDLLKKRGSNLLNICLLMCKASALHELHEDQAACDVLEEVYSWCIGNDLVIPVVEMGRYVHPLIEAFRKSGRGSIPAEWLDLMDKKATSYYVYQYNIRKRYAEKQRVEESLIELLTGSEQLLLLYISRGMTTKQIAEKQSKSISAVKGMARRLYQKIGATGIADAARIANEYNIEEIVEG